MSKDHQFIPFGPRRWPRFNHYYDQLTTAGFILYISVIPGPKSVMDPKKTGIDLFISIKTCAVFC